MLWASYNTIVIYTERSNVMNLDALAELLAFLFTDRGFNGDGVELWRAIIEVFQQIFESIGNLFS